MTNRVFSEEIGGDTVCIDGQEAHHLLNVLRLQTGDAVQVIDGRGNVAETEIASTTRRSVHLRVLSRSMVPASKFSRVTVAASPAKGDRLRWMVEKLTELGVARLVLLQTARTIVNPGDMKLEKIHSHIVSACKQSGRGRLMELSAVTPLTQVLHDAASAADQLVVAHPEPLGSVRPLEFGMTGRSFTLLIGPEGGFTDDETALIAACQPQQILWPENILRIETAAVVFASHLLVGSYLP
jgi:16S rRNA (uracil1498-N3)-methyltransferase